MFFTICKSFPLVLILGYVSAVMASGTYIIHRSSGKVVHPIGGRDDPCFDTPLVVVPGGLGQVRFNVVFEVDPHDDCGYGYIRHSSGKYVHPLGGAYVPNPDTKLVYYSNKHSACLFLPDVDNEIILHKGSQFIWHPLGDQSNPDDNTDVVLHGNRHVHAKFFFADSQGNKIIPFPRGHIIHSLSGKRIHSQQGNLDPADNTKLVLRDGGGGEARHQFQFLRDPQNCGYGYIRHVTGGRYVHPFGGSLQPANNTALVLYSGKHIGGLFKFDQARRFIIQMSSQMIWIPLGGSTNPDEGTEVVLHSVRDCSSNFHFVNHNSQQIAP